MQPPPGQPRAQGWLMDVRWVCQRQQGQKIAQPRSYLPRLDAVETHGHFRSRRLHQSLHFSFDGACQDQDRLAASALLHTAPHKHWAAWMHQGKRLKARQEPCYLRVNMSTSSGLLRASPQGLDVPTTHQDAAGVGGSKAPNRQCPWAEH